MIEVDAPGPFTGYALPELDVRSRYGVQILLVRRPAGPDSEDRIEVVPGPDTVLRRGDRLPVVGTDKAFAALSRW
jgi:Trk K+ transport system NAD-binding subunit